MKRLWLTAAIIAGLLAPSYAENITNWPPASGGGGGGSGTVTSVATACGTTGGPITTTGTISASLPLRVNTATSGAGANFVSTDCGGVVQDNSATSVAATLPVATTSGFGAGAFFERCNINTGVVTITPTTSTIGGAASYVLGAGTAALPTCVAFQSDGTNYNLTQLPGQGTVTSASVTTANGVSATVATQTTTPAFTFSLGAITPTSVNGNTVPTAADTVALLAATQSLTNKSLTSSTDVLGGVTLTLGSDATGDMYYRASTGVLTRLAVCTGSNVLGASGGLPACVAQSGGSSTITAGTTVTSGISTGNLISSTSNLVADSAVAVANLSLLNGNNAHTGNETHSGTEIFTSTSAPGLGTGGTTAILGTIAAPTLTATGQAFLYNTAANGAVLQGDGSTNDFCLANKSGTCILTVATGSTTAAFANTLNVAGALNGGTTFGISGAGVFSSSGAGILQWGAANAAAPVNYTQRGQGSRSGTDTNVAGATVTITSGNGTGNSTPSTLILQSPVAVASGTGAQTQTTVAQLSAGLLLLPNISSDATHTDATICEDTTTHALYSGSGTLGICLGTSSARYKNNIVPMQDGLAKIAALKPINYFYNKGRGDNGAREQYGFLAEDVQHVLPKLVALDAESKPNSVDLLGMVPILVKALQEQQAEIESLKRRVR